MDLQNLMLTCIFNRLHTWLIVTPQHLRQRVKGCLLVGYNMGILYVMHELAQHIEKYDVMPPPVETSASWSQWFGLAPDPILKIPTSSLRPEFSHWDGRFDLINGFVHIFMIITLIRPHRWLTAYTLVCMLWNVMVCIRVMLYLLSMLNYMTGREALMNGQLLHLVVALSFVAPMLHVAAVVGAMDFCCCCFKS